MVASCNSEGEATHQQFHGMITCPLVFSFFSAREAHPGKGEATGVQDKNKSEPVLLWLAFLI